MSNSAVKNKLDALTGLRAVAALAVFAQHFMRIMDCRFVGGPIGGVAVSFFFVLSGFILVYVYQDRLTRASTPKFYFTRFVRIWPLHIACLLLLAGLGMIFLPHSPWPWIRAVSHGSLLQSWYPVANWLHCYNGAAWSISVEAFFYLLFPWLLLGSRRQFWITYVCMIPLTLGGLVLAANVIGPVPTTKSIANATLDASNVAQFFPPFRVLEFMTGMATGFLFLASSKKKLAVPKIRTSVRARWKTRAMATMVELLVLALSLGCFQLLAASGLFRYLHAFGEPGRTLIYWFSFSGGMFFHAAVIYVFARSTGWISGLSGTRAMVFLGEISFAFYMIHYPVIRFLKDEFWFGTNFSIPYFALLALTISGAVSACLYFLVEVPVKDAALHWYSGKLRLNQLSVGNLVKPVQRIVQSPLTFRIMLALIIPIVITKVLKRADRKSFTANQVIASVSENFQPVQFGAQAALLAAHVVPRREAVRVNSVWSFTEPTNAVVSVHFPGTEFQSQSYPVDCGPDKVGQPLVVSMVVSEAIYGPAKAIEISLTTAPDGRSVDTREEDTTTAKHYPIFTRESITEGLRLSRLPTLTR